MNPRLSPCFADAGASCESLNGYGIRKSQGTAVPAGFGMISLIPNPLRMASMGCCQA